MPAVILSLFSTEPPGSTFKLTFPGPVSVLHVDFAQPLRDFWRIWRLNVHAPPVSSRRVNYSLVVEGRFSWISQMGTNKTDPLRVLVDTGCSVPLIIRRQLLSSDCLKPARFPVSFLTASGEGLEGGQFGLHISLTIPVKQDDDRFVAAVCSPLWAFEAQVTGVDIIVGYPFLALFGFSVHPAENCLRLSPSTANTRTDHPEDVWAVAKPHAVDSSFGSLPDTLVQCRSSMSLPAGLSSPTDPLELTPGEYPGEDGLFPPAGKIIDLPLHDGVLPSEIIHVTLIPDSPAVKMGMDCPLELSPLFVSSSATSPQNSGVCDPSASLLDADATSPQNSGVCNSFACLSKTEI